MLASYLELLSCIHSLDLPSVLARVPSKSEILFILGALLTWFLVQTGREKWRVYSTRRWPTAAGRAVQASYKKIDGGLNGIDYWKVELEYAWKVVGGETEYAGIYKFNVTSEEQAQGAVAGLTEKAVSVHYDPAKKSHGVLWEDEVWDIWWETYWSLSHPDSGTATEETKAG
jgi:hypothetical protein